MSIRPPIKPRAKNIPKPIIKKTHNSLDIGHVPQVLNTSYKLQKQEQTRSSVFSIPRLPGNIVFSETKKTAPTHASSFKPSSLPLPDFNVSIPLVLQIESNHGDPNIISLSEVDFLNDRKLPYNVSKVSPISPSLSRNKLSNLANHCIVKSDLELAWTHPWSSDSQPLLIQFDVESIELPSFIRIWNCNVNLETHVKHFSLFYHQQKVVEDDVPSGFGIVLPLHIPTTKAPAYSISSPNQFQETSFGSTKLSKYPKIPRPPHIILPDKINTSGSAGVHLHSSLNFNENIQNNGKENCFPLNQSSSLPFLKPQDLSPASDKYGIIPCPYIKTITLVVLKTYNSHKATYTGLNCVEFFDSAGELVPYSSIDTVQSSNNTTNFTSPYRVLKRTRRTSELSEMWIAQLPNDGESIYLQFKLKVAKQLVLMRIWNYNGKDEAKAGVKYAKVLLNDNLIWIGKVAKADGNINLVLNGITDIWLTDSTNYKDLPSIAMIQSTRLETTRPNIHEQSHEEDINESNPEEDHGDEPEEDHDDNPDQFA